MEKKKLKPAKKILMKSLEPGEFAFGDGTNMYKVKVNGLVEKIKVKKPKISNK